MLVTSGGKGPSKILLFPIISREPCPLLATFDSPFLCEKNDRYFLGTTCGFRQDEFTLHNCLQLIGAPFTIIGARIFISFLAAEALFPSIVRHSDIRFD